MGRTRRGARAAGRWSPAILAGVFTGAEFLVQTGISLPGSDSVPVWARGVFYMAIVGGGFVLRWYVLRTEDRGGR